MRVRWNFSKACLGFFALTLLPCAFAQSTPATTTADYTLQKFYLPVDELDPLGSNTVPACGVLVKLYADVMQHQDHTHAALPGGCATAPVNIDYLIVNYVVWDANNPKKSASVWFLLSPDKPRDLGQGMFAATAKVTTVTDTTKAGDRIFGSSRVGVLLVHRKVADMDHAKIDYTVTVKHEQSVQAGDLSAILNILGVVAPANLLQGAELPPPPPPEPVLAFAGTIAAMPQLPDAIAFAGEAFLTASADPNAKPDATFPQTYDDEGYSRWDISAAIPITGIKDVQYTQEGSTVTPKTVTRANAYALAHFYPWKVDLKGDYPWQPSIVSGLALSGKPLDKPFVGLAMGTKKPFPFQVNVFAGAVFNKVFTPASATDATQLNSHRVTKLLYGIDIPIGKLATAIKGKS